MRGIIIALIWTLSFASFLTGIKVFIHEKGYNRLSSFINERLHSCFALIFFELAIMGIIYIIGVL